MNDQNKKNEVENEVKEEEIKEIPTLTENEISLDDSKEEKKELPTIEIENKVEEEEPSTPDPVEEVPKEEIVVGPIETVEVPAKKKSHAMLIVIILAVILFVLGGVYFIFNNGKNLFLSSINKEYGNIVNELDTWTGKGKYAEFKNTSAVTKGTFNFNIHVDESLLDSNTLGILTEINKLDGTYQMGMDYKQKTIASTFGVRYNKNNMIDLGFYGKEKNLYLELKNLFDKYLKMPMDEFDALFEDPNRQVEDVKYLTKTIKDAFLNSLESKDFKKTSETIKVDKEDVKTTKISYTVNDKNIKKIYDKVLTTLKKDDTFIEKFAKYTGKSESDIKTTLEAARKKGETETFLQSSDEMILSVYTKGLVKEAVRYEMETKSGNKETGITYTKNKDNTVLAFYTEAGEVMNATFIHKNDKQSEVILTSGTVQMDIVLKKENENIKVQYALTEQSTNMKMLGSVTVEEKKENKNYVGTIRSSSKVELQGSSIAEFGVEANYVTSVGETVELPAFNNSIDASYLTETDSNTIMQNLLQNPVFVQFMTNIQKYIPNNPTTLQ